MRACRLAARAISTSRDKSGGDGEMIGIDIQFGGHCSQRCRGFSPEQVADLLAGQAFAKLKGFERAIPFPQQSLEVLAMNFGVRHAA